MNKLQKKKIYIIGMFFSIFLVITLIRGSSKLIVDPENWEDDFNDDNLDGWKLATYYTPDFENIGYVKGEVLIRNDHKRLLLPNPGNSTHEGANVAERNSTNAYGHWGFDINTTAGSASAFLFIVRHLTPETDFEGLTAHTPLNIEGYAVSIFSSIDDDQLALIRYDATYTVADGMDDYILDSINFKQLHKDFSPYGVYNIDITRTQDGNITVWVKRSSDSVYIKAMSVINNVYTISERISIFNQYIHTSSKIVYFDVYFDNIKVDNSTWVPETWTPPSNSASGWTPIVVLLALTAIMFKKRRKFGKQ